MALFAVDDRDDLYGPLGDHFMRIGDTQFFIPPTSISIHREMKHEKVSVIRGRNSLPKESGYFDRIITMTVFFPDIESINSELRPLLAQAKKSPFLPIQNLYLNDAHKIEAITIQNVTVQTTPGFPSTLQAIIQCYAFEPSTYLYGTSDKSFDEMFNWPLFRWYYNRNLKKTKIKDPLLSALFEESDVENDRVLTYFAPVEEELTNDFMFKIVAEDDLIAIREWNHVKKELVKEWLDEKSELTFGDWFKVRREGGRLRVGDSANEAEFNEEYDKLYEDAMYEYDLHYESWDLGRMEMMDFAISFENSIVSSQLQMHQSPTHQYMGSQDTVIVTRFQTDDMESLASLEELLKRTSYLTREYHKEVTNGFLQIDHPLAKLYGVNSVVIDDMTVDTVEGMPGVYNITLTLMAYNRVEKKMHEIEAMTLDLNWDISTFGNISPVFQNFFKSVGTISDSIGLRKDANDQAVYNGHVMNTFRAAELYPDLELPTYEEVAEAGFSIENWNDGMFVDPDFFISYDTYRDFSQILNESMESGAGDITMYDITGGTATLDESGIHMDDIAKGKAEETKNAYSNKGPKIGERPDISKDVDTSNLSTSEMEALIRKASSVYGMKGKFPVAFVKAFDPQMRQFYEVGMNPNLGATYEDEPGHPVTQTPDFTYIKRANSMYTGVMRLSYGNETHRHHSIEYNVDTGIRHMKHYWDVAGSIMQDASRKTERINKQFDISESSAEGKDILQYLIMVFLYLSLEKELDDLLEKNIEPNATITSLMNRMVRVAKRTSEWSDEKIEDKYDDLKVQDYKANIFTEVQDDPLANIQISDFSAEDSTAIERSMMHDMLKYDRRGRLVRAFPTFFMTFIDEGQYISTMKMSDQYFHYRAISDITYNNSRKQASSTLVCELSNVFGSLSDSEKAQDISHSSWTDLFLSAMMPGPVAKDTERSRNRDPNFYKSIYLRTGVRVHMRMGYGSNAMNLPTIMNGTITSLQNNGPTITMIAQDDGIELTNRLNAMLDIDPSDETSGFLSSKKEPTEILDELLTDSKGFWSNLSAALSNKEYQDHALGIMHFGETGLPQGLQDFQDLFTLGIMSGRDRGEINMNVYQTTGLLHEEQDKWYSKIKDGLGIGESDEVNININLFDKTVWDVLNITAAIGSDMITAVHPFGLRNTIFLGKPYFPIHYDYDIDLEKEEIIDTKFKSFKQMHIYDSYTSIIDNQIKATEDNLYTVAVGTYMNEGKVNTTPPVYVDSHIWPEKQKTVNIDTTLNAKGVSGIGAIPFIGDMLNKPAKWYFDEGVALKITASGLRDYMKDMYDGYLTVMGDPSVKPYDTMMIQDYYMDMNGPADVKEVVHIMNFDVGFITMLKPDIIAFNEDKTLYSSITRAGVIMAYASTRMISLYMARMQGYQGMYPVMNALWASTKTKMGSAHQRFRKAAKYVTPNVDINRWKQNGQLNTIANSFNNINKDNVEKILRTGRDRVSQSRLNRDLGRRFPNLQNNAGTVLRKGAKGSSALGKNLRSLGKVGRGLLKGRHAFLGPAGVLTFALETAAVGVLSATIGEFVERFLMNRQAVMLVPLKRDGFNYTAGINGQKGSVVSQASGRDKLKEILPDFLVDMYLPEEDESSNNQRIQTFSATPSVKTTKDTDALSSLMTRIHVHKDNGRIEEDYKIDVKAANEEITKRKAYLETISQEYLKLEYTELAKKASTAEGILSRLLGLITGNNQGSEEWDGSSSIPLDGKAVNLSKYFKTLGPMLDAEAKKQGVPEYAEILKAKTMQESGGNYERYPDVMQCSESLGLPRNSIGLERSLTQGVKYFKEMMNKANGDVALALQSYNYGGGFINYVKERGGKWTQELANSFSDMMAARRGTSGYGDKKYIEHIMRYYEFSTGGASDAPTRTDREGRKSYLLTPAQAKRQLIDARKQSGRNFDLHILSTYSLMRQGSYNLANQIAEQYEKSVGQKLVVTSLYRANDPNWHGTGYAIDFDTPNTMRTLSGGKLGFPEGRDKRNAQRLVDLSARAGFKQILFGDWFIIQDMKRKYPHIQFIYEPSNHHNHLHLSYPDKV